MKERARTQLSLMLLMLLVTPLLQAQTGIVTGRVVMGNTERGVPQVKIKCAQNGTLRKCELRRSDANGDFRLTATPLEALSVTARKDLPDEHVMLFGSTQVFAYHNYPAGVEPPFVVRIKRLASASVLRQKDNEGELVLVLTSFRLALPVTSQSEALSSQDRDVDSGPSVIAGTIDTVDNRHPGTVRVVFSNDETDDVIKEEVLQLSDYKAKNQFTFSLKENGRYSLAIVAEGYYQANYLIIKQSPAVIKSGANIVKPIPLVVMKGDGSLIGNPSGFVVSLAPLVKLKEEGLSQLINKDEATRRNAFPPLVMQSLPVPGLRSFDSFALLAPGVVPPPQTGNTAGPGVSPGVGTPGQFSVNGMRTRENNFTVDGSDNNDEDIGVRRQGFVALVPQSIESLQEFQIVTALADTRFGRNAGGQVNALSKTGTLNWHGTLYGFLTDRRLNARDFFDQEGGLASLTLKRASDNSDVLLDGQPLRVTRLASDHNPFTRIQMGATIGGPTKIFHDTFFFSSLEKQIIHANKEVHFSVPTVQQRGIFNTGETGVTENHPMLGLQPLYPASVPGNAIFSLYPFPNNPSGPYGTNTYTTVLPASGHGTRFSTKVDHEFVGSKRPPTGPWWKSLLHYKSYNDRITGRYNLTDEKSFLPTTGGALYSTMRPKVRTQNVAFFLNRLLSTSTSDTIRLSFGRTRLFFGEVRDPSRPESAALPGTNFLLNAPLQLNLTLPGGSARYVSASSPLGTATLNSLGYAGITQTEQLTGPLGQIVIPGFSSIGVEAGYFPQERANNTFQVADTITSVKGKDVLTFGVDLRHTQINSVLDKNFRPQAVFGGLFSAPPFVSLQGSSGALTTNAYSSTTLAGAGIPSGLFQTIASVPDSAIGIRFTQVNAFLQDERRVGSNFRLIAGLRYELNTVPDTANDRLEHAFDSARLKRQSEEAFNFCGDPVRCGDLVTALAAAFPADFRVAFGADHSDMDGRLGFAWVPGASHGRLAIRGGFGAYSGQFPGIVIDQSRNAFSAFLPLNYANFSPRSPTSNQTFLFNLASPAVQQLLLTINPTLQIVTPGTLNTFSSVNPIALLANSLFNPGNISLQTVPLGLDLVLPQRRLKTPYSLQVGLTAEYQFKRNYVVSLAYVGTRGIKLLRVNTPDRGLNRSALDRVTLDPLSAGAPFPFFRGRQLVPQTNIISSAFTIARTLYESSSSSTYHSLQLEVRKRYSNNLQFGSALTYSHAIDDASDFFDTAGAFALPQNSLRRSERASSGFDVRWRSVSNFVFDLPKASSFLAGTQVAGTITAQTGQPYTINTVFDVNHDGNLTDRPNTTTGLIARPTGSSSRVQLALAPGINPLSLLAPEGFDGSLGRNIFRAPGLFTIDLSVSRSFKVPVGENTKIMVRSEIFNVLNRANYGIPVRILEAPGFGRSFNTTTPARTIQLSLKVQF